MDLENHKLQKEILHDILRRCRLPKDHAQVVEFIPQLPHYVRIVWSSLAADSTLDTDIWSLYSRVAIIGMYYLNWYHSNEWNDNDFLNLILRIIYHKEHRIKTRPTMNIQVRNSSSFTAAMVYGLTSLITFKPGIYQKDQLTEMYNTILDECRCHTRHTSSYFVLMYNFVHLFNQNITYEESVELMRLAYNNVDRKDSILMIKAIVKSPNINATNLFNDLNKITWNNKYKFVVLTELLAANPFLVSLVNHEEYVKVIINSQSNSGLASVAGKLYSTLVDEVSERVWVQKYFPAILTYIMKEHDVSIYQKNTFKYILIKTFKHYFSHFSEILNRKYPPGKMPVHSILNLTRITIDNKFDKAYNVTYDFAQIMENSYFHPDISVRCMFFYILVNQDFHDPRVFPTIKEFIVLNINDADNGSRDYIKKTYDMFIKNLLRTLVDENEESKLRAGILDIFNWFIKFLFHQFKPYCNYQRLALSFQMIYITFFCFKEIEKDRRLKLLHELDFYKNPDYYLDFIKDMLLYSNKDDSSNVIKLALEIIPYAKFKQVAKSLQEEGLENICSANIETSLCAERAIEFYMDTLLINKKHEEHKNMLRILAGKVALQWIRIQESDKEDIVTKGIAFGAPLNLVSKNLSAFHPINIFTMIHLAERIVHTLMEVFQIRAMIQYKGDTCYGIALAFAREHSPYHAVTVNTMWLSLKSVCKLLLALVHHVSNDYIISRAVKCLKNVIRNCYHKGVLEEASTTLSATVAYCTHARQNILFLEATVTNLLKEIPCVPASNSTVRRCAEKRLILCSIVLSDKRPAKPLYHKAMSQLCSYLNTPEPNHTIEGRCLVLHCLQPLLTDTQVETHAAEYYERVVLSILNNFQDPSWNIRNAALQAFGAISHKLLGSPTSSDKIQRRSISLEELIYRYRNLYPVFIVQIKAAQATNKDSDLCKQLHAFAPIGCLLSMTYSRGEELHPVNNSSLAYLTGLLILLLKTRSLPEESILIARAFTAICHTNQLKKRIKLTMYDPVFKHSNFFGWVYLIRCLCDKLLAETANLPEDPKEFVLSTTDQIIKSLIVYDETKFTKELRYAIFILYRSGVTAIGRKFIEYHFEFFCEKDPDEEYPQFWIDDLLVDLINHESIIDLKVILKNLLFYDFPLDLKRLCFVTLNERITKRSKDNQIFSELYAIWLVSFLNNSKCWSKRIVSEECIKLLLKLKINAIDEKYNSSILEFVENRDSLPDYFCTVLFVVYEDSIEWKSTPLSRELCLHCVENCYFTLDGDQPDLFILESVIYICKYAKQAKYLNLLVICADLTYQLLQEDNDALQELGEKTLEVLFETKGTFPFANILYLVDNIERLVGDYNALDFLGAKYWERYCEAVPLNAFEQEPVLKVHSSVLKDRLIRNFNTIYDRLDDEERVEYYSKVLRKTSLI